MGRFKAIGEYFDALSRGDPVALGFTAFFVAVGLLFAAFAWVLKKRVEADDRRYKERQRQRRGY